MIASIGIFIRSQKTQALSSSTDFSSLDGNGAYRGPLDDCIQNSVIYGLRSRLISQCTLNYVHFASEDANVGESLYYSGPLRIASFNLYHLGDNQAPIKNLGLMAKIMNQWDLVGAQEMMPLPQEWSSENQQIYSLVTALRKSSGTVTISSSKREAMAPGYLRLLVKLQELDVNWSLILQPLPEGEGSSGEMAGFFYRANRVSLKEWDYCPGDKIHDLKTRQRVGNYGCLIQVPSKTRQLMSRVGFTAYFRSGTFDFVGVTTHVRFRPADSAEDQQSQKELLCAKHEDIAKCSPTKDEVGRFFEVAALLAEAEKIRIAAKDSDIIYSGDFNLQDDKKSQGMWRATLNFAPGFSLTQSGLTTLSVKGGKLSSNYDHFIIDGRASAECDLESVKSFDFTSYESAGSNPIFDEIRKCMTKENQQSLIQDYREQLKKIIKFQSGKKSGGPDTIRGLSQKELQSLYGSYERALQRMSINKYGVLMEQLSDHIPVEMSCKTLAKDDD